MADKFEETDNEIINLFIQLKQANEQLADANKDAKIDEINEIISKIKDIYIERILSFDNTRYNENDLKKYSITKLQEIYTNYKEYGSNNKCNIIQFTINDDGTEIYECSFLILLAALFNKKNYILTKLFTNQGEVLNENIMKVFNYISNKTHYDKTSYADDINEMEYLIKKYAENHRNNKYFNNIYTYFKYKNQQTNIYNFLYLFQEKLMRIPDDTCKTSNSNYNKKIFYNVKLEDTAGELQINNKDNKLSLTVLLENEEVENEEVDNVIITDIPLIFLIINNNINKKVNIPEKIELDNNVLYLNSIILKYKSDDIDNYICVFECNNSWYWYNSILVKIVNVFKIGNFNEMLIWRGPKDDKPDYVRENVVGLFYT
jgi:hypothetical protein